MKRFSQTIFALSALLKIRNSYTVLISAFLVGLVSLSPAVAATIPFTATMDCAAANAGAGTCGAGGTGTGSAVVTLDDVSNLLSWNVVWSGLSVAATAAHFHGPATPAQSAGVQVGIGVASNPAISSTVISAAQETALLNGLWYINIHSSAFPGGEIRGQVNVVPIPPAVWLFGSALGLLGWMRRKKAS